MSPKRKKNSYTPRHYTTREIMELTEQRRLKNDEAASKETESKSNPKSKAKTPEEQPSPQIMEHPQIPVPETDISSVEEAEFKEEDVKEEEVREEKIKDEKVKEENVEVIKIKKTIPPYAMGSLVYILILIAFLTLFSKLSESWVNAVAAKLNTLVAYGSFFILNMTGPCTIHGTVLNTHYYRISLQGDLVAFYSIELLIIFAVLFALFQRITRIKRGMVFISLIPLAIIANILRVVMACGLALNNGPACANWYLHGILVGSVFIFIILGLIIIEYLSSTE